MSTFLEIVLDLVSNPDFTSWLFKKLIFPLFKRLILAVAILVRRDDDPLDTEKWMGETLGIKPPERVLAPPVKEDKIEEHKAPIGFLKPIPGLHPLEYPGPEPQEVETPHASPMSKWLIDGDQDSSNNR